MLETCRFEKPAWTLTGILKCVWNWMAFVEVYESWEHLLQRARGYPNQSSISLHTEASFCHVRLERPIIISLPMCMIPTATIQGKPSITALPGCPGLPNAPHNTEFLTTRELEVYFSESFIILIFKKSQILIKQGNCKQTFCSPSTSWNLNSDFALLLAQIMWSFFPLY